MQVHAVAPSVCAVSLAIAVSLLPIATGCSGKSPAPAETGAFKFPQAKDYATPSDWLRDAVTQSDAAQVAFEKLDSKAAATVGSWPPGPLVPTQMRVGDVGRFEIRITKVKIVHVVDKRTALASGEGEEFVLTGVETGGMNEGREVDLEHVTFKVIKQDEIKKRDGSTTKIMFLEKTQYSDANALLDLCGRASLVESLIESLKDIKESKTIRADAYHRWVVNATECGLTEDSALRFLSEPEAVEK